ncbi:MAG: hypothetical protein ATN33_07705 [Epulopiscium sp. Nele67-Bin001]|nr:MAG: hypothetical protein ATN33_07705 [Epulopiscium sp. Nele67-Bin001]
MNLKINRLLSNVESVRRLSDNNFEYILRKYKADIDENQNTTKRAYQDIKALKFIEYYQLQEASDFKHKVKFLKENMVPPIGSDKINGFVVEITQYNQKLQLLNEQAEQIRYSIRLELSDNLGYSNANKLVSNLRKVTTQKNELLKRVNMLRYESKEHALFNISCYEYVLAVITQIKVLDEQKNVKNVKEFIHKSFSEIRLDVANKFMPDEYNHIKSAASRFAFASDLEAKKQFEDIKVNIAVFKIKLKEVESAYLMEKELCQEKIKYIENMFSLGKFYNPTDYLKLGENAPNIYLIKFLETYCKNAYVNKIGYSLGKLKKLVVTEQFIAANKEISWLTNYIEEAISFANFEQERIAKNIRLAIGIRDVMRAFGYETSTMTIDGDRSNGYNLVCVKDEEVVEFVKIYVDKDDNPVVEVIEDTISFNTWISIADALMEQHIFVEEIIEEQ